MTKGNHEPADPANEIEDWREPPGWLGEYVRRVKQYVAAQNSPEPTETASPG